MNKILLAIITFSVFLFAESPQTNEINFKSLNIDVSRIDDALCDSIFSEPINAKTAEYRALCKADGNGIEYNSPLDYSVVFVLENDNYVSVRRESQTCKGPFLSGEAEGLWGKAQFSDVLFAELMRLQKYGVVVNNADSLKNFLLTEIEKMKDASPCEDIDMVFYDEENGAYYITGPGCCSLVEPTEKIKKEIKLVLQITRVEKIKEGVFYVHGIKKGAGYAIFDVNGKLLDQGINQTGLFRIANYPALLRIQNQYFVLK